MVDSLEEIKDEIARFFEELYEGENIARPTIDGVSFPTIPLEVQSWLDWEFEEAEMYSMADALAKQGVMKVFP